MTFYGITIDWRLTIASWGAILSTILALIKIKEVWNDRFKIDVSYIFRGHAEVGHDIFIQNLSGKPVLLECIEVFRKNGPFPFSKKVTLWSHADDLINEKIEPQSSHNLNFSETDYFVSGKSPVFIRLKFAGRKPITKRL